MASYGKPVDDERSEANASEEDRDLRPLKMSSLKFQELLQTGKEASNINEKLITSAKARAKLTKDRSETRRSRLEVHEQSQRIGERVCGQQTQRMYHQLSDHIQATCSKTRSKNI